MAILPFLPDKFPNMVIPLVYSGLARIIADKKQLSKEAILASANYVRCSAWNVTIVCLVSLVSFVAIAFSLFLALDHFGILNLD